MNPRGERGRTMPSTRWSDRLGHDTGLFAVVFLAYAAGAVLSWESFGSSIGPAFFFPSAGVTAAAIMLNPRSRWPAIVAAVVLGEVLVDIHYGNLPGQSAGFALANVVEPLIGGSLVLAWCGGTPDLQNRGDFFRFLTGACVVAPLAGGLIGGYFVSADARTAWMPEILHWWGGDALGVLVVATPIMLWPRQSALLRRRPGETVLVLAVTMALSVAAFWTEAPPSILILPVLAWAALRLDMIGAALAGGVAAFLANVMTSRGHGFFSALGVHQETRLALTQVFIGVIVVVSLLVAQEASGRTRAVRERNVERRERLRLETLSRLAQQLSAAITARDIGVALEDQVLNDAGANALNLGLISDDGRTLQWAAMTGYPAAVIDEYAGGVPMSERTAGTDVARTGRPILIRSSAEYEQLYPEKARWVHLSGTESLVAWPLDNGDKPIGTLLLAWPERQPLSTAQLAYVSAVATMVSQALVRARIYTDEHARAAVLQSAVLPSAPADVSGMDVCVAYEAADVVQGVGGDWYDVLPLPKDRTYFAVGDVVGHGLAAVEDMAQLRSAGRAFAHQGLPPAQLLAELNGFTKHASLGRFATMAVAVFDSVTATLAYASAGHPPPLLRLSSTGRVVRLADGHGPVLGPLKDAGYAEGRRRVEPGDILLMYTDGLVERRGVDIEAGIAAAEAVIAGWDAGTNLNDACETLHEKLAPRPRRDDICVLAVRFG